MSPSEFLEFIFDMVPEFRDFWLSENNYSISEDGSFNFHSVCSEFSSYFIDQEKHKYVARHDVEWQKTISDEKLNVLLAYFESHIEVNETRSSLSTNNGLLSNAICTCFLENISQTNAGEYAKSFMGEKSRAYFYQWHIFEKKL